MRTMTRAAVVLCLALCAAAATTGCTGAGYSSVYVGVSGPGPYWGGYGGPYYGGGYWGPGRVSGGVVITGRP